MEAITGLDSHLCLQSWPAGTHRPLRRAGIIQDRGIVIRSRNPSRTSLGEGRNGGDCAVSACLCRKQVPGGFAGVQLGLLGWVPHISAAHMTGAPPVFCFTSTGHKCKYKWHIWTQFEVGTSCSVLIYFSFICVWTGATAFWHMYQTIIKLNEGHNWKRKLGPSLNLHVCIVKVAKRNEFKVCYCRPQRGNYGVSWPHLLQSFISCFTADLISLLNDICFLPSCSILFPL